MAGAPPGSSAQGEHPKFCVRVHGLSGIVHALVKFSPPRNTAIGRHWADQLIAEGIAGEFLDSHGIVAARAGVLDCGERMIFESERSDRVGADGRRGVVTLHAVDAERYGQFDRWASCAARLHRDGLLSSADNERLALLEAFAELIGNIDRHFGNVTLYDIHEGPFTLAPVYDMLPMVFAPADGPLIEREFDPGGARAETLAAWPRARASRPSSTPRSAVAARGFEASGRSAADRISPGARELKC